MITMRKPVLWLLLLILSGFTTGCWNRHESDKVEFVLAAGVDVNERGQIVLTVLTPVLEAMKPSGSMKGEQKKTLSVAGDTSFEAVRNYIKITGRKLYWSHLQVLLIGEQAAKMNVQHYLDFFSSDPELRGTAYIATVKGRALDVLEASPDIATISANYMRELLQHSDLEGSSAKVQFTEFARKFAEPIGGQPFTPIIYLIDQNSYVSDIVHMKPYKGTDTKQSTIFYANGTGVYRDGKLIGTLNGTETRGFNWAMGTFRSALVTIPCPDEPHCQISLELSDEKKSRRHVSYTDGRATIRLNIYVEFNLGDKSGMAFKVDRSTIPYMEKKLGEAIKNETQMAFKKIAVDYRSDIFAFGNTLEDQNPKQWKLVKGEWEQSVLPNAKLEVQVTAKLRRTSRTLYSPWVKTTDH